MAQRTPCFRRCSTIRVASPNQEGVERTDWEEVWMITDPSAILFIGASLMEVVLFFLLKEAHFYLCSLQVTSRCASRGQYLVIWRACDSLSSKRKTLCIHLEVSYRHEA